MVRGVLVLLLALSACGRFGFGASTDGGVGDGSFDVSGDVPADVATDAAIDGQAAACLPAYRVCDGFEANTFAGWQVMGNVTRDLTVAHRGNASAHFHTTATAVGMDNYVDLSNSTTLAFGDPTLYVRAWIRSTSYPLNNMGMIAADQAGTSAKEVAVFFLPNALGVFSQFDNGSRNNLTQPPLNTWFCVIWQLTRAATATGTLAITGDQPPAMLTGHITDGSPPISELSMGIHFAGSSVSVAQPAMDIWIDDVIASPTPVSCAD
jgi:hypothetical protein